MSLPTHSSVKSSRAEWIGHVPTHWREVRLKFGLKLVTEKASDDTPKLALENIESWTGRFLSTETEFEGDGTAFVRGDVLFGKLRPYLAKALLADEEGQAVGDFHVLRPTPDLDGRFALYYVLSRDFIAIVDGSTYGAKMPRASWEFMSNLPLPLPPLSEQTAISAFLDRETGKIDALVEEQRRLIELLKEKRQAVISHAVTKGLNPNAKMKPSGVEWLGDVPEHWNLVALKFFAEVGNGSTPNRDNPDYWRDGTYPWLNSSVVNANEVTEADQFVTARALEDCHLPIVRPPAILVGITGQGRTRGMATLLSMEATINQHIAFIRPTNSRSDCDYLLGFFEAAYEPLRTDSEAGSTKGAITCEQLSRLIVPLPPVGEQEAIKAHLARAAREIEALIAASDAAVELLLERRAAIISAAVTGKIEIREPAAARTRDVPQLVAAEIIGRLSDMPTFGRVKFQKIVYLAEVDAGISEFSGNYVRAAAGPLDYDLIISLETALTESSGLAVQQLGGNGGVVTYRMPGERGESAEMLLAALGDRKGRLDHIINVVKDLDTKGTEAVATLYAVWNDFLLDGKHPSDDEIVADFLHYWHPEKREKFRPEALYTWLGYMRRNSLTPSGTGPSTTTGRLFV